MTWFKECKRWALRERTRCIGLLGARAYLAGGVQLRLIYIICRVEIDDTLGTCDSRYSNAEKLAGWFVGAVHTCGFLLQDPRVPQERAEHDKEIEEGIRSFEKSS